MRRVMGTGPADLATGRTSSHPLGHRVSPGSVESRHRCFEETVCDRVEERYIGVYLYRCGGLGERFDCTTCHLVEWRSTVSP
jgi:hypothetical protein